MSGSLFPVVPLLSLQGVGNLNALLTVGKPQPASKRRKVGKQAFVETKSMLKKIWFQVHWLLGITAGIVLAVVGVTGATLSFEHEIKRWINPGVMTVTPQAGGPLSPADLLARVQTAVPGARIASLTLSADPENAARVLFAPKPGSANKRGEASYLDPYTGELLGKPDGEKFFRLIMEIHRWLAAGDTGKAIVGASTIALIVLCLSGLYLRWPRNALNWRAWLSFDVRHKGRSFLWSLHAVAGTWALLFYLMASLTGLYWSYNWYRDALFTLTGTPRPAQQGMARPTRADVQAKAAQPDNEPKRDRAQKDRQAPQADVALAWSAFRREVAQYKTMTLRLPDKPGQQVQITYLDAAPAHDRANNRLLLHPVSGAVIEHERYTDKPAGAKLMSSMFALHSGSFFGLPGLVLMMLASAIMPLFAITGWMLYLDRRRKKKNLHATRATVAPSPAGAAVSEWLIGFASQTGFAERLAWQTAGMLRMAGVPVTVQPLCRIDRDQLGRFRHALFVVSTFGDGEAPDHARPFTRLMRQSPSLAGLSFGLLALGSRQYQSFCGFGRSLDHWLHAQGAQALFDRVEVDNGDPGALKNWQSRLGMLAGRSGSSPWTEVRHERWRLAERCLLNPGSCGGPAFHLVLEAPASSNLSWKAGDLVDVSPRHSDAALALLLARLAMDGNTPVKVNGCWQPLADVMARSALPTLAHPTEPVSAQQLADTLAPLADRQYSIASIPEDGGIHLLVRQAQHDGEPGICSGWLTRHAAVGAEIELRIRSNTAFHLPGGEQPLILIGNGTGLAGLRSHLKARARNGHTRNWLIFGERNAAHDFYFRDEIENWQAQRVLQRVDLVFSRDQAERIYVQDRLRACADLLQTWLADGATILVCGSLEGMAPGVDAALVEIVGADQLEYMIADRRYRRDVY